MRFLLLLFCSFPVLGQVRCDAVSEKGLVQSYQKEWSQEPGSVLDIQKISILEKDSFLISDKNSCGANGCEYSLYRKLKNDCYKQVLGVKGKIKTHDEKWSKVEIDSTYLAVDTKMNEEVSYTYNEKIEQYDVSK